MPLSQFLDRIEAGGLALRSFVAVLAIRPGHGDSLLAELERQDRDRSVDLECAEVPGLHSARWTLLDREHHAPDTEIGPPVGPLVLALVFDGSTDDVLEELIERYAHMSRILEHCVGFSENASTQGLLEWLKRAGVKAGYLFHDVSASREEILEALEIRRRFTQFYAEHQGAQDIGQLRADFDAFRREMRLGFPHPLTRFEERLEDEDRWIRRAVSVVLRRQARLARHARRKGEQDAAKLRGFHAKHHGYLRAKFRVHEDVPAEYQVGVFQPGACYDALIRPSNGDSTRKRDSAFDARGLAIKLPGVQSKRAPALRGPASPDEPPASGRGARAASFDTEALTTHSQDFVLMTTPTFFLEDIRDFTLLISMLDVGTRASQALRLAIFGARRGETVRLFLRALLTKIRHPLNVEFQSGTAYLCGEDRPVKYQVTPLSPKRRFRTRSGRKWWLKGPDFLRAALQESLLPKKEHPIELEFALLAAGAEPLPVEDPRPDWVVLGARRIPVATITIESDDVTSEKWLELAEKLSFNPWHCLPEHRPLGNLNRARFSVYKASHRARARDCTERTPPLTTTAPPDGGGRPEACLDEALKRFK